MEQIRGAIELTRPGNAIAAGVLTFIGAFVAGGLDEPLLAVFAVAATILATGGGNAINDYFDREIDAINRPGRPLPRGAVSPRGALVFSLGLFIIAISLTLLLPILAIGIAVVNLLALIAYTEIFKGLPGVGNALVGYLTGSTFLFGGAAVGGDLMTVLILFVLAACATVAREIVKDVEDIDGDRQEGLNTLPIALGERNALSIAAVFIAGSILASPIPYLWGTFGSLYLLVLLPAVIGLITGTYRSFSDPTGGQQWLKTSMFVAAIAFVVGRAVVVF